MKSLGLRQGFAPVSAAGISTVIDVGPPKPDARPYDDPAPFHHPASLVCSRDGETLYVACSGKREITVIERKTLTVSVLVGSNKLWSKPDCLAFGDEDGKLYFSEPSSHCIRCVRVFS